MNIKIEKYILFIILILQGLTGILFHFYKYWFIYLLHVHILPFLFFFCLGIHWFIHRKFPYFWKKVIGYLIVFFYLTSFITGELLEIKGEALEHLTIPLFLISFVLNYYDLLEFLHIYICPLFMFIFVALHLILKGR